jgi:hypothetical protein
MELYSENYARFYGNYNIFINKAIKANKLISKQDNTRQRIYMKYGFNLKMNTLYYPKLHIEDNTIYIDCVWTSTSYIPYYGIKDIINLTDECSALESLKLTKYNFDDCHINFDDYDTTDYDSYGDYSDYSSSLDYDSHDELLE